MSAGEEVRRARAFLLRVAEPPAPALVRLIAAVGPVEAAERVRAGAVPESVARETAARRTVDRVDDDLAAAHACGARLLTPEDPAWPHWALAALEIAAYGPSAARLAVHAAGGATADGAPAGGEAGGVSHGTAGVWPPAGPAAGGRPGGAVGIGAPIDQAAGGTPGGDVVGGLPADQTIVGGVSLGAVGAGSPAQMAGVVPGDGASGVAAPDHGTVGGTRGDGAVGDGVEEDGAGWPRRGRVGAAVRPVRGDLAPPIALWVRGVGALDELCDQAAAIVGARAATGYGLHVAGELGAGLAAAGFTVVSGAAIGVDGAAHRGALAAAGPSVAVLACGVDRSYPAAHEALLERIAATGVIVSEYPPGAVPARHRFLVRNRLIAGLAGGTVVVEAGLRSGAQRTAADACALGRPVMAVPGPVTSGRSAGCHRMIRDGAVLVTRVEEVLEEVGPLGLHLAEPPTGGGTRPTDGLSALATLVNDALPSRAAQEVAWLATEAGVPPNAVRAALDELVQRELVEQVGARWQRPQHRA